MSDALIGLLGAVLGASLTGGAKLVQDWQQRSLASRTAARILMTMLDEIHSELRTISAVRHSPAENSSWAIYQETWVAHQEALARVVPSDIFSRVAYIFVATRNVSNMLTPGSVDDKSIAIVNDLVKDLQPVRETLEWAGFSQAEKNAAFLRGHAAAAPPLGNWPSRLLS